METGNKIKHMAVTLFLCGDVMTGRGIDQILPHPGDPRLHEGYVKDARGYVDLAERASGPIPRAAGFDYVWGDALAELKQRAPDLRLINLETSITTSNRYWRGKGINYRMHPANTPLLTAARIDACALANNHVLDWGYEGLTDTLRALENAGVRCAGAGENLEQARAPAVLSVAGKGRVLFFSLGSPSSGIPLQWAATVRRPGVNLLPDLSRATALEIAGQIRATKRPGDIVVASIHWGGNWGHAIPAAQREFARLLIDEAGVDLIHGHSSHHAKGIEVYRDRLILYGAGDFLTDYEGIQGYEEYRGDLSLMYFARIDPATGSLSGLQMVPTRVERFRINRASRAEAEWLKDLFNQLGKGLGTRVEMTGDNSLQLRWD